MENHFLFELFHEYLLSTGVDEDRIIEIALDDRANSTMRDPDKILSFIKDRIKDGSQYYVLLDEVQIIDKFSGKGQCRLSEFLIFYFSIDIPIKLSVRQLVKILVKIILHRKK